MQRREQLAPVSTRKNLLDSLTDFQWRWRQEKVVRKLWPLGLPPVFVSKVTLEHIPFPVVYVHAAAES